MQRPARRLIGPALLLALTLLLTGCPPAPPPQAPLNVPVDSLTDIILRINANNRQIPTLWAHQQFDGVIHDDKGNAHVVSAYSGVLLYRAPSEMRLLASNEFGPIFEVGLNDQNYWMKVVPELDTLWWGKTANIGKPCGKPIPIRPDLLMNVLALGQIDPILVHEPFPILRFNNTADCYMIDFLDRLPDRLVVEKEIWYDRQTLNPTEVLLYEPDGRKLVSARLSKFQPVPIDGQPQDAWPTVATDYDLFFYDNGNTMKFRLSDIALTDPKTHTIPKAGSIHLPDLQRPDVKNVIQLDADCDQ
jgi:hypothetical protein